LFHLQQQWSDSRIGQPNDYFELEFLAALFFRPYFLKGFRYHIHVVGLVLGSDLGIFLRSRWLGERGFANEKSWLPWSVPWGGTATDFGLFAKSQLS